MQSEKVAEAIRAVFDDPVLIGDSLYYHTTTEDGTQVRHPLDRPRDISREVMRHLCNRLPPDLSRTVHRSDIIEFLRTEARREEPSPDPWDVTPNPKYEAIAEDADAGLRTLQGPPFVRLVISQILARRVEPDTRVPIIFIVGLRSSFPTVVMSLHNLCGGAVHVHAPGHGNPPAGTLATVFDRPPALGEYLPALWLAVRGGTDPAPVPVVLCDYSEWAMWKRWMMARAKKSKLKRKKKSEPEPDTLPPMWAYEASEPVTITGSFASVCWAGALSTVSTKGLGAYLPARVPSKATPEEGAPQAIRGAVGHYRYWHPDPEPDWTASQDDDPGGSAPPGSTARNPRARG